ncbi:MAG: hypothetical protein Q4P06_04355 [Actinomycetaceae bacterium]|nr:hypothetical protein [Actinomycetaceae bacterium]
MRLLQRELSNLGNIIAGAFRLIAKHWVALVVLYCAGFTLRFGALWLAGRASHYSGVFTAFILPFAPLFTIASLALMLRVLGTSLPNVLTDGSGESWRTHIKATVVALIPFLAIYASNGFLKEDMRRYSYDQGALVWEQLKQGDFTDEVLFSRIPIPETGMILALVVIAVGLRKYIAWKKLASKFTLWALISAYLEALWLTSLAYIFTLQVTKLQNWVMSRQVVDDINTWWVSANDTYTLINSLILTPFTWLGSIISSLGALVVVPVAWLTIGATLYGAELKQGQILFDEEVATARIKELPSPVQRAVNHVISPALTPLKSALKALRKIAVAGLLPMLVFCLLFGLTGWVRVGVDEVAHYLLGARSAAFVFAVEPVVSLVESLVYFILTLALLAAAVSQLVGGSEQAEEPRAQEVPAPA